MSATSSTCLGQLGLLPLEIRVRIYEQAIISEGTTIHVGRDEEFQRGDDYHCRPLEKIYTIQKVSATITNEISELNVPSSVCTFVIDQPRSLEALLQARACRNSWIRNLKIRSTYPAICRRCIKKTCDDPHYRDSELAVARSSYWVWERAFKMLGPQVRHITIDVSRDLWYMDDTERIKKRTKKLAAMAAESTDGRARIKVYGGCLVQKEQKALEAGVKGVIPSTPGSPYQTFGGKPATAEQAEAEFAVLRERLGDAVVKAWGSEINGSDAERESRDNIAQVLQDTREGW